jgi:uncharacterized protein (DUF362 family)
MTSNLEQPVDGAHGDACQLDRRTLLTGTAAAVAGLVGLAAVRHVCRAKEPVFLARHQQYHAPLARTIRDGLKAVGFDATWVRDRSVLLKPNLVETSREASHITTHPAIVVAAAEVFRRWGARVLIGEAPGHVRDTEMALIESGFQEALDSAGIEFIDLNYSEVTRVRNAGGASRVDEFFFPAAVASADLVVTMPKLKTHHWVGMTAAMKNLYGTLPGLIYGWPKNVLHYAGIPETVFDINASLPPRIAIVDGILCMEGDGPILGTPKAMGLIAISQSPTAVDATLARIIGLDPDRIGYLTLAANRLGPVAESQIPQRGERWQDVADAFEILDAPHLTYLRHGAQEA